MKRTVLKKATGIMLSLIMTATVLPQFALNAFASSGADAFVTRCYKVVFQREPDEDGFAYWTETLDTNPSNAASVACAFIFSEEYKELNRTNEEFVKDLYYLFMGREADKAGFDFWCNGLSNGMTRDDVLTSFANSAEFITICESFGLPADSESTSPITTGSVPTLTNSNDKITNVTLFVERLYKICLNRTPDKEGIAFWVNSLLEGQFSSYECAMGFIMSPEYTNLNLSDAQYVENLYACLMNRPADAAGKAIWLEVLSNGTMTREQVFNEFATSQEFADICESYGIN